MVLHCEGDLNLKSRQLVLATREAPAAYLRLPWKAISKHVSEDRDRRQVPIRTGKRVRAVDSFPGASGSVDMQLPFFDPYQAQKSKKWFSPQILIRSLKTMFSIVSTWENLLFKLKM